jgi:hypothetical protein
MEAVTLANSAVPETAMSGMCGESAGEWHAPPDPRFAHPTSRPNIPTDPPHRPAKPWTGTHNSAYVSSNWQGTVPSTNPSTSVSFASNQNLLVDYLREFMDEKDKVACKVSKTQLKSFDIISNGKCANGVPCSDPTQFVSTLCAFVCPLAGPPPSTLYCGESHQSDLQLLTGF